jgi:hypothetical protein
VEKIAKKVKIILKEITKEDYPKNNSCPKNLNSMHPISNVDKRN